MLTEKQKKSAHPFAINCLKGFLCLKKRKKQSAGWKMFFLRGKFGPEAETSGKEGKRERERDK